MHCEITHAHLQDAERAERAWLAAIAAARPECLRGDPALGLLLAAAADEFHVKVAAVTLVGAHRQTALAVHGADPEALDADRADSFCDHAIRTPDTLLVPDAAWDPRFAANRFVTGGFGLRFYAGAPLWIGDGQAFGAFCLLDSAPRLLGEVDRLRLHATAAQEIVGQHGLTRALFGMVSDALLAEFDASRPPLHRR